MPRTQHIKLRMEEEADMGPLHASFQRDPGDPPERTAPDAPDESATRRPAFQEDAEDAWESGAYPDSAAQDEEVHRAQEDWGLYPDMVYQTRRRAERRPIQRVDPSPYEAVYADRERNRGIWAGIAAVSAALVPWSVR